jgi:hypothetical protein
MDIFRHACLVSTHLSCRSMSRLFSFLAAFLLTAPGFAQHGPVNPAEYEVMEVIETMFDGMRALDADKVASTFTEGAVLNSSGTRNGTPFVQSTPMSALVNAIRQSAGGPAWDERIWNVDIEVNDNLATAWMDYAFFAGDRFSHCGSNTFQLARQADGHWRTIALADTRVMSGCEPDPADLEESLVRAFHEVANLYWVGDNGLMTRSSEEYIAGASGQPAANESERARWIDWVDISGDASVAKITLDYPGAYFNDYMQLLKIDGRWQIVNKIFHVERGE